MIPRLLHLWARVRSSLWFVPACMSLAAAVLALAAGRLDAAVAGGELTLPFFVYAGDRDGARTVLSTVAGSMITVAGVTFSVTVVALALASSQFGPRLLVNFMRDRGNQLVLGTFIATFLYCLLALGQGGSDPKAVPAVSATLGLLLAVASVAVLIFFIHHISSSIRAEQVVDGVARDLERGIDRLFPRSRDEAADPDARDEADAPGFDDASHVLAAHDGYIQRVDEERLVSIASAEGLVLKAPRRAGHFVVEGETILLVSGGGELEAEVGDRLRACFLLGRERTPEQDPEHGIHQLVEVAVRALSPGVNDPYTALSCVDWLGAMLCRVGPRPLRSPRRADAEGRLRLQVDPIDFEGLLAAAFQQIRQFGRTTPAVSIRVLELLERVAGSVAGRESRREAVRTQADTVLTAALSEGLQPCDREDLEARHRAVLDALEASG